MFDERGYMKLNALLYIPGEDGGGGEFRHQDVYLHTEEVRRLLKAMRALPPEESE